jgi:hypothetical protein
MDSLKRYHHLASVHDATLDSADTSEDKKALSDSSQPAPSQNLLTTPFQLHHLVSKLFEGWLCISRLFQLQRNPTLLERLTCRLLKGRPEKCSAEVEKQRVEDDRRRQRHPSGH